MNELHDIEPLLQKFRSGLTSTDEEYLLLAILRKNEKLLPPDWLADLLLLKRLEALSLHTSDQQQQQELFTIVSQLATVEQKKHRQIALFAVAACALAILLVALPWNKLSGVPQEAEFADNISKTAIQSNKTTDPIPQPSLHTAAHIRTSNIDPEIIPLANEMDSSLVIDTLPLPTHSENSTKDLATVFSNDTPKAFLKDTFMLDPTLAPPQNMIHAETYTSTSNQSHNRMTLQGGIGILAAMSTSDNGNAKAGISGNIGVKWELAVNENYNFDIGVSLCGYATQENFTDFVYSSYSETTSMEPLENNIVTDTIVGTFTTPSLYVGIPLSVKFQANKHRNKPTALIFSCTPAVLAWEFLPTTADGKRYTGLYNPLKLTLGVGIDTKQMGAIRRLGFNANLLATYNRKQSSLPRYHEFGIEIGF